MHPVDLPPAVIERLLQRRGQVHVIDQLHGPTTALLIVDMQVAYLGQGQPAEIPLGREIVTNVNRLGQALRDCGGLVIWIQNTLSDSILQSWPTYTKLRSDDLNERMKTALSAGSAGHALWPGLQIAGSDLIVKKTRYSIFADPAQDFERTLRSRGIRTVIVSGVATNVCCESTIRDAMMRNFPAILVSDATATRSDEEHQATLISVVQSFGDVMTSEEILERLGT